MRPAAAGLAKATMMTSAVPGAPPLPSMVLLNIHTAAAILAALERIPELERRTEALRSLYQGDLARQDSLHQRALLERDERIERLAQRAERVEAAARRSEDWEHAYHCGEREAPSYGQPFEPDGLAAQDVRALAIELASKLGLTVSTHG